MGKHQKGVNCYTTAEYKRYTTNPGTQGNTMSQTTHTDMCGL